MNWLLVVGWLVGCGAPPAPTAPLPDLVPSSVVAAIEAPEPAPSDAASEGASASEWVVPPDAPAMPPRFDCRTAGARVGCFVPVPGARFHMGAQATDPSAPGYDPAARPEEGPVHEVSVSSFWLHRSEVDALAFVACEAAGACEPGDAAPPASQTPGRPARQVTWHGADRLCGWLGGRLPTEAEWARAARGPEGRRFPWGDEPGCGRRPPSATTRDDRPDACPDVAARLSQQLGEEAFGAIARDLPTRLGSDGMGAMCLRLAGLEGEALVQAFEQHLADVPTREPVVCDEDGPLSWSDQRPGNPHGLAGMAGSLWEWTADGFGPYAPGAQADPRGVEGAPTRAQRGSSYLARDPLELRAAVRAGMPPDLALPDVGVRCAWGGPGR